MNLRFVQRVSPELLEDVTLIRERIWLQHDEAPPHFSADVRNRLNDTFPGRWIGRRDPILPCEVTRHESTRLFPTGISKTTCL